MNHTYCYVFDAEFVKMIVNLTTLSRKTKVVQVFWWKFTVVTLYLYDINQMWCPILYFYYSWSCVYVFLLYQANNFCHSCLCRPNPFAQGQRRCPIVGVMVNFFYFFYYYWLHWMTTNKVVLQTWEDASEIFYFFLSLM